MKSLICVASLVLLLPAPGAEAQDYRHLKGPEIGTTLAGAEFTDESDWSFVFERGGRLRSVRLGKPGTGTWKVENDELCATNGPGMIPCHQVWIAGTRLQLRRADDVGYPEEGVLKRSAAPPNPPVMRPAQPQPRPPADPPQGGPSGRRPPQ